jgi:hypothetical protein
MQNQFRLKSLVHMCWMTYLSHVSRVGVGTNGIYLGPKLQLTWLANIALLSQCRRSLLSCPHGDMASLPHVLA